MNTNIRIFISSTFQDMHAERDYLIKKIFPEIINEAAKRFVTVVPLDLRWGITDDEAKSGKVVDICLSEIDNSRPYFIGIIGDRYGWCPKPEEINLPDIEKRFPGIKQYVNKNLSITEIEMQYAVLDTDLESNALFLLKQTSEEGEDKKLSRLKECIKQKRPKDWYKYNSVEQLGKIVKENFMNFLDVNFPQKNFSDHEKLRWSLKNIIEEKSIGYINNNPCVCRQLLDNIKSNEPSVELVIGGQGNGKSSFIANFIHTLEEKEGNICIYYLHDETVTEKTLECILRYFNKRLNDDSQPTDSPQSKPMLVVMDGIDRLPNFAETDLYKLLDFFKLYHLVLTLDSGSPYIKNIEEYTDKPYCNRFQLKALSTNEKFHLIEGFLQKHRKKLSHQQCSKLIEGNTSQLTSLCTALSCLVSFGHFENLDDYISKLTQMDDKKIFMHAMNQIRDLFGKETIDKILALIIASKHGLEENELREILGLRQLDWSSVYSSLVNFLVSQNSRLMLKDGYKEATGSILTSKKINDARQAITRYFRTIDTDRSCDELAYQYLHTEDYDSLYNLILCYKNFKSLYLLNEYELATYWRSLIEHDPGKYSLEVYSILGHQFHADVPLPVEHDIVGDFILFHFNDARIAIENYEQYEKENHNFAVSICVFMDDDSHLSPKFWYCYSQAEKDRKEKMKYLEKAIKIGSILNSYKEDSKYTFLAYIEIANFYIEDYDFLEACRAVDKASAIRTTWFANDLLMNAMECRIVSRIFQSCSLPEKAIEAARHAVMYSAASSSESIQSHANLLNLLICLRLTNPSFEEQAYTAAQALKTEAKRYFGQNSLDYAKTLIELSKSYTVLLEYVNAGKCLKQAREIYKQKDMPVPVNLNDKDFKTFNISYDMLCNALGNLYAYQSSGVMDIAAAYHWLKEYQQPNNELYLHITKLRNKQLEDFENCVLSYDEEYICRLVFPSDNSLVDEEVALEQIKDKDFCNSRFYKNYAYMKKIAGMFSFEFPTSTLDMWIKRKGANKVIHQIKLAIIRGWMNLKKEFPELQSNVYLTDDDKILDAAERMQNKELQSFLILLLEFMIEMEGFEIDNRELYLKHQRENIVNGFAKWKKAKEQKR